jgi:hypothetical protein
MLRLLVDYGVFAAAGEAYVHNEASRVLGSGHPQSLRDSARMSGRNWPGLTDLATTAATGRPVRGGWEMMIVHHGEDLESANLFNRAMAGKAALVVPAVLESYDFARFDVVADIGGGRGQLIRAILRRVRAMSGILFDLPHVIADAAGDPAPRLRLIEGDFFADPLPSANAYLLMDVLHDWDNADAQRILAGVRRAAPADARLLIIETLIADSPGRQFGRLLDVVMLAFTGGRERTPSEYANLLANSGFRLERVLATPTRYSIAEAVAA